MTFILIIAFIFLLTGALYFFQEKVIFFPEVLPQDYRFSFDAPFEELDFVVEEGVKVNALHFQADEPRGIVFYSHGNAGSLRGWGYVSEAFLKHHYDVLIYDYRGYGKSGGKISEEALYHDAEIIYGELLKSYDEDQIIVYGRSIGTGIAMHVAANHHPRHLILESPYYNFPDLAGKLLPLIPRSLVRYKFGNNEKIVRVSCPITIIHGTSDEVIYFGSSRKLESLFKDTDKLVPIEGGHHNDLINFDAYHVEIAEILH